MGEMVFVARAGTAPTVTTVTTVQRGSWVRKSVWLGELLSGEDWAHVAAAGGDVAAWQRLPIAGLAYDSRRVEPDFLFAAWAGTRTDGHQFIAEAARRGAAAALCEHPIVDARLPCLPVPQVRRVLACAAQRFYGDPSARLRMFGVTGTNGKTTTAHLLESILAAADLAPGIIGTLGSRCRGVSVPGTLTTPESVDLLAMLADMERQGSRAVAMEVSSQALHQQRAAGLRFDVALFTNLTQDHLDYHGTMAAYLMAKAELLGLLKPDGVAVINMDDGAMRTLYVPAAARQPGQPAMLGFSVSESAAMPSAALADVYARDLRVTAEGLHCTLIFAQRPELTLHSPLLGRFNGENVVGAAVAAVAAGIPDAAIVAGIANLTKVAGRLERVSRVHEPLVLVDYAHTPDALQKALAVMREVVRGQLGCVFGCGGDRDAGKRAPMGEAAARGADWSILTNDNPRGEDPRAIAAAVEVGLRRVGCKLSPQVEQGSYCLELDRSAAIARAVAALRPEDGLLIAGKGHEGYQIIGSTQHAFDDRQQARLALDAVAKGLPYA